MSYVELVDFMLRGTFARHTVRHAPMRSPVALLNAYRLALGIIILGVGRTNQPRENEP